MINLTDVSEIQRYIRQLEIALMEEKAMRQKLEESVAQKQTYIDFIDSFVATIGRKLGVSRRGQEGLKDIDKKIGALLARR